MKGSRILYRVVRNLIWLCERTRSGSNFVFFRCCGVHHRVVNRFNRRGCILVLFRYRSWLQLVVQVLRWGEIYRSLVFRYAWYWYGSVGGLISGYLSHDWLSSPLFPPDLSTETTDLVCYVVHYSSTTIRFDKTVATLDNVALPGFRVTLLVAGEVVVDLVREWIAWFVVVVLFARWLEMVADRLEKWFLVADLLQEGLIVADWLQKRLMIVDRLQVRLIVANWLQKWLMVAHLLKELLMVAHWLKERLIVAHWLKERLMVAHWLKEWLMVEDWLGMTWKWLMIYGGLTISLEWWGVAVRLE